MSNLAKYKAVYFGASVDPIDLNKQFTEKGKYNFILLSDPDKTYAKKLGILAPNGMFAQRVTYVIDEKGIIRDIHKPAMLPSYGKELVQKMDELKIPKKPE